MSRSTILDDLTNQLDNLTQVTKATMRQMVFADLENFVPYIGVIPGDEMMIKDDGYDKCYGLNITLLITTNEDNTTVETMIAAVKTLIDSIDLGSSVLRCDIESVLPVDINENNVGPTRYSSAGISLNLIYTENSGSDYPAIETRTLTSPTGVAHYKLYETLVSGSTTIQSLGTNVYDSHSIATLSVPAHSGSISVDSLTNTMDEDNDAVYDDELIENHLIGFNVKIHSNYNNEYNHTPNPFINRLMVDNITSLLWGKTNSSLGDNYRVHRIGEVSYNQTFEYTLGASMDVIIEKIIEY